MPKAWYVVHAYSGHENKVEKQLRLLMERGGFGESIFDVKVPSEQVIEIRDGKKRTTSKKFLPGYEPNNLEPSSPGSQMSLEELLEQD